jgi:hypothetical protein
MKAVMREKRRLGRDMSIYIKAGRKKVRKRDIRKQAGMRYK